MSEDQPRPLLYLVVCAAPPARHIDELVELLHRAGWRICVIPTPHAASWLDCPALAQRTGYPIRHDHRLPGDPDSLPRADAIAVVPATFNTINKWATGISDTFALGILNEAIGLTLPIIIVPYAKPSLAAHPEFGGNLKKLAQWGVNVLPNEVIRMRTEVPNIETPDIETQGYDKPVPHFLWWPVVEAVARSRG